MLLMERIDLLNANNDSGASHTALCRDFRSAKRMSFGIEDPFVQINHVRLAEHQVEVFKGFLETNQSQYLAKILVN